MAVNVGRVGASLGFDVDNSQIESALGSLNRLVSIAGRVESGVGGITDAFGGLRSIITQTTGALIGYEAVAKVTQSITLAARYQEVGFGLLAVARNAKVSAAALDQNEMALRKSGISAVESRNQILRLLQAHIDLKSATKLADVAKNTGIVGGINTSETFSRINYAISSAQPEMLRTLGIQVSFEDSYKKMKASINGFTGELSEQQKVQARTNAVIEAGAAVAGLYDAAMETAGKQMRSTQRYLEDMQVAVGKSFQPAYTQAVFLYAKTLKFLGENTQYVLAAMAALAVILGGVLLAKLGAFIAATNVGTVAIMAFRSAVAGGGWVAQFGAAFALIATPMGIVVSLLAALAAGWALYVNRETETKKYAEANAFAIDEERAALEKLFATRKAGVSGVADTPESQKRVLQSQAAAMQEEMKATEFSWIAIKNFAKGNWSALESYDALMRAITSGKMTVQQASEAFAKLAADTKSGIGPDMVKRFMDNVVALGANQAAQKALQEQVDKTADAMERLAAGMLTVNQKSALLEGAGKARDAETMIRLIREQGKQKAEEIAKAAAMFKGGNEAEGVTDLEAFLKARKDRSIAAAQIQQVASWQSEAERNLARIQRPTPTRVTPAEKVEARIAQMQAETQARLAMIPAILKGQAAEQSAADTMRIAAEVASFKQRNLKATIPEIQAYTAAVTASVAAERQVDQARAQAAGQQETAALQQETQFLTRRIALIGSTKAAQQALNVEEAVAKEALSLGANASTTWGKAKLAALAAQLEATERLSQAEAKAAANAALLKEPWIQALRSIQQGLKGFYESLFDFGGSAMDNFGKRFKQMMLGVLAELASSATIGLIAKKFTAPDGLLSKLSQAMGLSTRAGAGSPAGGSGTLGAGAGLSGVLGLAGGGSRGVDDFLRAMSGNTAAVKQGTKATGEVVDATTDAAKRNEKLTRQFAAFAGGLVLGNVAGSGFKSPVAGGAFGAVSGAATGFMTAGVPGAIVGGIGGLISGIFSGSAAKAAAKEAAATYNRTLWASLNSFSDAAKGAGESFATFSRKVNEQAEALTASLKGSEAGKATESFVKLFGMREARKNPGMVAYFDALDKIAKDAADIIKNEATARGKGIADEIRNLSSIDGSSITRVLDIVEQTKKDRETLAQIGGDESQATVLQGLRLADMLKGISEQGFAALIAAMPELASVLQAAREKADQLTAAEKARQGIGDYAIPAGYEVVQTAFDIGRPTVRPSDPRAVDPGLWNPAGAANTPGSSPTDGPMIHITFETGSIVTQAKSGDALLQEVLTAATDEAGRSLGNPAAWYQLTPKRQGMV